MLGGTFDYLHLGHKLLLSCASLLTKSNGNLEIGVTSLKALSGKSLQEEIEDVDKRLINVK